MTAREAYELAETARRRWAESDFAVLCCIYAGALENENPAIGPLALDGSGPLWHFDYYAAEAERFLRVQVYDGKARSEVTKIRAGGLNYPQMQLPFAAYGYCEDRGREAVPSPLPEDWSDSSRLLESFRPSLRAQDIERLRDTSAIRALVMPASCLRAREDIDDGSPGPNAEANGENCAALIVEKTGATRGYRVITFDLLSGEVISRA